MNRAWAGMRGRSNTPAISWGWVGSLFLAYGLLLAGSAGFVTPGAWHIFELYVFVAGGTILAWTVVYRRSLTLRGILCDHRWTFLGAYFVFFIIGDSLVCFGSEELVAQANALFAIDAQDATR